MVRKVVGSSRAAGTLTGNSYAFAKIQDLRDTMIQYEQSTRQKVGLVEIVGTSRYWPRSMNFCLAVEKRELHERFPEFSIARGQMRSRYI